MTKRKQVPKTTKSGAARLPKSAALDKQEALVQGQAMLAIRISDSKSYAELARMFGVSSETVQKRLRMARAAEFTGLAQEIIMERMLPKALAVLDQELESGNYEAAKDLLFGSQVYQKGGKAVVEHITSNSPTLESIRRERAKAVDAEVIQGDSESERNADDGGRVAGQPQLPPARES